MGEHMTVKEPAAGSFRVPAHVERFTRPDPLRDHARPQIAAVGFNSPVSVERLHSVVETVEMHGVDLIAGINPAPAHRLTNGVMKACGVGPGFTVDRCHKFASQCARTVCPDADDKDFIPRTAA